MLCMFFFFFAREALSHSLTLRLNEQTCLQWNLDKSPGRRFFFPSGSELTGNQLVVGLVGKIEAAITI